MEKKNHKRGYIAKEFCNFLSSSLVSTKHKIEFNRYLSTGVLNENTAIELYDNLLYNLQRKIAFSTFMTIVIGGCIIGPWFGFDEGIVIILMISGFISYLIITIIGYYPLRIITNMIYPKKYRNGSNRNYHLTFFFNSTKEERKNIRTYLPSPPIAKKIGSYAPWTCPKCQKKNFIENRVCAKCDFEEYWKCQKCDSLNISDNSSCIKCNLKRGESDYLEETWACPECKEENENIFTQCWRCTK